MLKVDEICEMFKFSNMKVFEKNNTIQVVLGDPEDSYKNLEVFIDVLKMYKKHIIMIYSDVSKETKNIRLHYFSDSSELSEKSEKNNAKFTEYPITQFNTDVKLFYSLKMPLAVWTNIGHLFEGAFILGGTMYSTFKYISHKDYSIQECYDIFISNGNIYVKLLPETDFTSSKAKIVMNHLVKWTKNDPGTGHEHRIYAVHTNENIRLMDKNKMLSLPHYIYTNDAIFTHNPEKKSVNRSDNIIMDIKNIGKETITINTDPNNLISKCIDLGSGCSTASEKPVPPRELYIIIEYKNRKRDYIQYPIGDTLIDNIEEFRTLICDWAQSLSYEDRPFIPPMVTAIEYRSKNCYNFRMLGVNDLVKLNNKEINEVLVKFDYNKF